MANVMNLSKANEMMRQVCEGFSTCKLKHWIVENEKEARYELVDDKGNRYTIIARAGKEGLS